MRLHLAAMAIIAVAPLATQAETIKIQPDEADSKDVFVYEFAVPGTLGIPTPPNTSNFDSENIPASSAVGFGGVLGAADTVPFRLDPSNPEEPLREHDTRTLIEFDLSSVGFRAGRIDRATLSFFAVPGLPPFDDPAPDNPVDLELRAVTEAWSETDVTWVTQPGAGDVIAATTLTGVNTAFEFDVTETVRGWLETPGTNFGFQIGQDGMQPNPGEGRDRFSVALFGSSAQPDAMLRPSLTVSEVPIPASMALLGGGLALLGGLRAARRRT